MSGRTFKDLNYYRVSTSAPPIVLLTFFEYEINNKILNECESEGELQFENKTNFFLSAN